MIEGNRLLFCIYHSKKDNPLAYSLVYLSGTLEQDSKSGEGLSLIILDVSLNRTSKLLNYYVFIFLNFKINVQSIFKWTLIYDRRTKIWSAERFVKCSLFFSFLFYFCIIIFKLFYLRYLSVKILIKPKFSCVQLIFSLGGKVLQCPVNK